MKVIVFGGSGFLGSHLADALTGAGHTVTIFDLEPSPYLSEGQHFIQGDILDAEAAARATAGQEVVYNFAGLADLNEAYFSPVATVRLNVLGNAILLEAARQAGVKRYIFASSIYVYSETGGFYRASKQACELYIEEYQRQYGLDYTVLRYGTVYGRRANEHNSVHRYLKQALLQRRIEAYGTGDEVREYIHVEDAARVSVEVLAGEYANQHVVLTGHHAMRFRDLLNMIREIVGTDVEVVLHPPQPVPGAGLGHYNLTPYTFRPKIGRKLVSYYYLDMGQGLLDCLEEIHSRAASLSRVSPAPVTRLLNENSPIKAIVFDFDGVILESTDIKTKAFRALFADRPQVEQIVQYHLDNAGVSRYEKFKVIYRDILRQSLTQAEEKRLNQEFSRLVYEFVLLCPFVEGATEFLAYRATECELYIASGTPQDELRAIVAMRGLDGYFRGIYGTPRKKGEIVRAILAEDGWQPSQVIFVGDAPQDHQAALESGVGFVGRVPPGKPNPFAEDRVLELVPDLTELARRWPALLTKLQG